MMFEKLDEYEKSDLILFVLDAIDEVGLEPIGKKQFQKVIYIIEAVSPVKETIDNFIYRKKDYGPYSKDIQNILNILMIYGLAKRVEQKPFVSGGKKRLRTTYSISDVGRKVVGELQKHPIYKERSLWVQKIVKIIKLYGIGKIVELVYAEPTFKNVKKFHAIVPINDMEENLSMRLMEFLMKVSEEEFEQYTKNDDLLLIDFFDFLYAEAFGGDSSVR